MKTTKIEIELYPRQAEFYDTDSRLAAFVGGIGLVLVLVSLFFGEILDLLIDLEADESTIENPILYVSARKGTATLDLKPGWKAPDVNAALSNHPGIPWSMAPIRWDRNGRAAQELFLFTPKPDGFAPVDVEQFRQNFEKAWATGR